MSKVIDQSDCWVVTGRRINGGYEITNFRGKAKLCHRIAWEWVNGPIPSGMCVCHHCDNPPCCNPDHLFLGTRSDNMRDAAAKKRLYLLRTTHCKRSHPLTGENLMVVRYDNRTFRRCRTCARANAARARIRAGKKYRGPNKANRFSMPNETQPVLSVVTLVPWAKSSPTPSPKAISVGSVGPEPGRIVS